MKQNILNAVILLLIVAAVMALAYWLPWVATGLVLIMQIILFAVICARLYNNEERS